ncbi:NAD-dependent dihydropyrimidine dehydrogenase subunit PreA-like [Hibiscus syriacus]|uniref:NAD-dependent dihydropyrimidine dehydrogenase subunit PreA-like n=1 Tax=Hibiscus syriacus TaxID=106335 RepID=A0A6A3B6Q2_HIBSY|nr:NAD-dependent dihydropyrimidine dehydrogenase subunit PreA-like [Hibiscus syriacus]
MESNKSEDLHQEEEGGDSDDVELLKTRISSHPLYGRLVENHLNCLKLFTVPPTTFGQVGGIGIGGRNSKGNQRQAEHYDSSNSMKKNTCSSMQLNQSDLDLFMEGYCSALSKLKEAMEEPQLESIAFINGMHSQLRNLAIANPRSPNVFLIIRCRKTLGHLRQAVAISTRQTLVLQESL